MTKKTSKREKGITLIALIVTIIVLLILAGVTISLVVGNQGIIGKTKDATLKYTQRQAEEQVALLMQEYTIDNAEKGTTLDDFLKVKKEDGTITDYKVNNDGTAEITKDGYNVKVSDNRVTGSTKVADSDSGNKGTSGSGSSSSETSGSGSITYTDSAGKTQTLTKDTPTSDYGTKIGNTTITNSDNEEIKLDWYLFDVSDDGKIAYLVSTPTYWVPDTKKEVRGAWVPKLVSNYDDNTNAIRQAIQKLANGTNSYNQSSVSYNPSPNTLSYYKNVNSQWSAQRGSTAFASLNENEQSACYLADADIFAGIKDQVNNAEGNLKGKIQTLVGGASIEQWCKAYNKQSAAKDHKITCEYRATSVPGYIYKVNDKQSTVSNSDDYCTGEKTIVGNDIYGAAHTNNRSNNSTYPFSSCWWWLASPSAYYSNRVCGVSGDYSDLFYYSHNCDTRFSLLASVAL